MEELLRKMEVEKLNYSVIKNWYVEFKANIEKCRVASKHDAEYIFSNEYAVANKIYEKLFGALWGLKAVGYISLEVCDDCVDELIATFDF